MSPTAILILAAGRGSRMKSAHPKVLHEVGGASLLHHVLATARDMKPDRLLVVTGPNHETIQAELRRFDSSVEIVIQNEPLGTGHAVAAAQPLLKNFCGNMIVLYGDTPFIRRETLSSLIDSGEAESDVTILGFETKKPDPYGRLVFGEKGQLTKIVEAKDANESERQISFCNSGVMSGKVPLLFDLIGQVKPNPITQELYLTDIIAMAHEQGLRCQAKTCQEAETLGINCASELSAAESVFQETMRQQAVALGVILMAPHTVHFSYDTKLAPGCIVEPYVVFGRDVKVDARARICSFSHLNGCWIKSGATVGPFARIRPKTIVGTDGKVGNFVELKQVELGKQAKANHLTYLGNTSVGEKANIGAGTITCNYDGKAKHNTVIGKHAFIGSDSILVAPIEIGDGAITAAGSTLTTDVPSDALAIARPSQSIIKGFAQRFFGRWRSSKK